VVLGGTISARFARNRPRLGGDAFNGSVSGARYPRVDCYSRYLRNFFCACSSLLLRAHPNGNGQDDLARRGARRSSGVAFASKYRAATVGIAVVTTSLIVPVRCARRLQLFLLAAGGVILGISLGAPMTFLKPVTVWRDVVANVRAYGQIHSPEGYLRQATSTLELGVPLLLAGLSGFILMLWQAKTRAVALGWICFVLLLIVSFMGSVPSTISQLVASGSAFVYRGCDCVF